MRKVEVVLRRLRPGKRQDPVDVGADHAVLGCSSREALEAGQFAVDGLARLLRQVGRLNSLAQLADLRLLGIALAELLLDRLHLLAEEELTLALLHLRLDLRLDLGAELEDLELPVQDPRELAQSCFDVRLLEELLLFLGLQPQRGGDEVGERARIVHVRRGELELGRKVRDERDNAPVQHLDVPRQRHELRRLLGDVGHLLELPDEVRIVLDPALEPDALDALDEDAERPVRDLDQLVDDCGRAHAVEVVPPRLLDVLALDGDEREQTIAGHDVVDQLDRALLADRERGRGIREDDRLLQRQDRQRRRQL